LGTQEHVEIKGKMHLANENNKTSLVFASSFNETFVTVQIMITQRIAVLLHVPRPNGHHSSTIYILDSRCLPVYESEL
jgi:ketol-acid reductoisomerase